MRGNLPEGGNSGSNKPNILYPSNDDVDVNVPEVEDNLVNDVVDNESNIQGDNSETIPPVVEIPDDEIVDIVVGNDSIIADYAAGIKNIVKIKSLSRNIDKASFTIITKSGNIYPFDLTYNETPLTLSVYIGEAEETAFFTETPVDKNKLEKISKTVIGMKPSYNHLGDLNHKMIFSLDGIYSVEDLVLFHLHLENLNNIDYTISKKYYIKDIDKYVMDGEILTLNKKLNSIHQSDLQNMRKMAMELISDKYDKEGK